MSQRSRLAQRREPGYWCQCGHRTRYQVGASGTSSTRCTLCTRHQVRKVQRAADLLTKWEQEARRCAKDDPRFLLLQRAAMRVMRLVWRAPWSWEAKDSQYLSHWRGERGPASFAQVRKDHAFQGECFTCGAYLGAVSGRQLRLPRMGAPILVCRAHWPEALAEGQRRLTAKYPQTSWRLDART